MDEDEEKEKVKAYLEHRGLNLELFTKQEMRAGKTPDFRVYHGEEFLAYCEVKSSPEDRWLDAQLEEAGAGEIVGGTRNDPIFNRLTSDIHKAVQQFDAVNEGPEKPNILALVNHDNMCGFNDLLSILTGNFYAADGTAHPIYRQFSHGRIKDEKARIHLFLWLDDHNPDQLLYSQTDGKFHACLCEALNVNDEEIQQIDS